MKVVDAGYTGTHKYSFRCSEKGRITGVKMVQPDGAGKFRPCFEVVYADGVVDYSPVYELDPAFLVEKFYEPTEHEQEAERLARIICDAAYGEGMQDVEVNTRNLEVIGNTGMRFMLPGPDGRRPLWMDFWQPALAIIKDREAK